MKKHRINCVEKYRSMTMWQTWIQGKYTEQLSVAYLCGCALLKMHKTYAIPESVQINVMHTCIVFHLQDNRRCCCPLFFRIVKTKLEYVLTTKHLTNSNHETIHNTYRIITYVCTTSTLKQYCALLLIRDALKIKKKRV